MAIFHIDLTDRENDCLMTIARKTGKSQDELLRDAIHLMISQFQQSDRRALLRSARGMWKDRTDLPSAEELRREFSNKIKTSYAARRSS